MYIQTVSRNVIHSIVYPYNNLYLGISDLYCIEIGAIPFWSMLIRLIDAFDAAGFDAAFLKAA